MKKFKNVNIFAFMQVILDSNTKHYKDDFKTDKKIIKKAWEDNVRNIIWLSRTNGTHCLNEAEAYMQDSYAHNAYLFYWQNNMTKGARAFVIELQKCEEGVLYGDIYEMDYAEHAKRIALYSGEYGYYEFQYEKGVLPVKTMKQSLGSFHPELGKLEKVTPYPMESSILPDILCEEKKLREKARECVNPTDF